LAQSFYEPERFSIRSALTRWFRCFKYRPAESWAQLAWDVAVLAVLCVGVGYFSVIPFMEYTAQLEHAGSELTVEQTAAVFRLIAGVILWILVGTLFSLVSDTAWHRLLTGRDMKKGIPYRLGADEGRALATHALSWVIMFGVMMLLYFALMIPMLIVTVGVAASAAPNTSLDTMTGAFVSILMPIVIMAIIGMVMTYVMYALLTGVPLAIRRQRLEVFGGWRATRGFGGRLFLAGLVLGLISICVSLIFQVSLAGLAEIRGTALDVDEASPTTELVFVFLWFGGSVLLSILNYHLVRGILAEAAMVVVTAETREVERLKAEASPPVSPDGPDPAPEAV